MSAFTVTRTADCTTIRCRCCGDEITWRGEEPVTARNSRRAHVCKTGVRGRLSDPTRPTRQEESTTP
jgi:hypothetical protein